MDISTGRLKSDIHTWIYPWTSISTASLFFVHFAVVAIRRNMLCHLINEISVVNLLTMDATLYTANI